MILDNLYKLTQKEDDSVQIVLADAMHPLFKAHFENNPLLPAFVHIDIIEVIFSLKIKKIKRAKFKKIVKPCETVVYKKQENKITVFVQDEIVASFVF